jgi:hypothetical protein
MFFPGNPFGNLGNSIGKIVAGLQAAQNASEHPRCCPAFQLQGEFLLDTSTGRVWKYDERESAFVPIPKKLTAPERKFVKIVRDELKVSKVNKLDQKARDLMYEELNWMHEESRQW